MSATYFCGRLHGKSRKRFNGEVAGQYGKEKKVPMTCGDGHVHMIDRKPTVRGKQYLLKEVKAQLKPDEC